MEKQIEHLSVNVPCMKVYPSEVSNATSITVLVSNKDITKKASGGKSKKIGGGKKNKLVQTLRDNEEQVLKKFQEKIRLKEDAYNCCVCEVFITRCLLIAKNHAYHCGELKKRNNKKLVVSLKCNNCEEKFSSRKDLADHFKSVHRRVNYSCSKCSKMFKYRKNYRKHLEIHKSKESPKQEKCPECGKTFQFRSYLNRHLKMHTRFLLKSRQENKVQNQSREVMFEANQVEIRRYGRSFG